MKTLFIDKLEDNDLGGYTTDLRKAEYILAVHKLSFDIILNNVPKTIEIPSGIFPSGKYVVFFNVSWDLSDVQIGFINYNVDLDENFDLFADSMSPKAVAGFHQIKEKIKLKDKSELEKIKLSDNDSDFEIAYKNYIEYHDLLL